MSKLYDRKNKKIIEDVQYKGQYSKFLYNNLFGRIILKILILPFVSKIAGIFCDSKISVRIINGFIKDNNIDMSLYEKKDYSSFNDFFGRKKIISDDTKANFDNKEAFVSPADSRLLVYKFDEELQVKIKDSVYSIEELTKMSNDELKEFKNGNVFVFRLYVDDYHRYCYIDDGKLLHCKNIRGVLHTVNPISSRYRIYKTNHRIVSLLETKAFEKVIYIEVGALLVGKIINHDLPEFKKGDEKGYFKYGGSTVVVITKDNVKIDEDIIENSKKDIETKVSYGERIGDKKL